MRTLGRICLAAALTVVAAGLLGSLPAAAQLNSRKAVTEDTAPTRAAPSSGGELTVDAKRLGSVLGIEVRTNTEQSVGRIVDLLASRNGQVEAAVIEFGGFLGMGTRKIAIEWPALRLETSGKQTVAILDMTRDHLRAAPEYKADQPIVVRRAVEAAPPPEAAPPARSEQPEQSASPPSAKQAPAPKRKRRHHTRDPEW